MDQLEKELGKHKAAAEAYKKKSDDVHILMEKALAQVLSHSYSSREREFVGFT